MNDAERAYWDNSYNVLYDTWMQELLSEELLDFWGRIDAVSAVLVAITVSGSTIAGWALWQRGKRPGSLGRDLGDGRAHLGLKDSAPNTG